MFHRTISQPSRSAFLLAAVLLAAGAASADDRALLRDSSGNPYLFVIFDTSTSMANAPPCTRDNLTGANDVDPFDAMCSSKCELGAAKCQLLCPDQGCVEYDMSTFTPPSGSDIITRDEESASLDGIWTFVDDASADSANNDDFRYAVDPSVLKSATYIPGITSPGEYQIYLWWPEDPVDAVPPDDPDTPENDTGDGVGETFASNTLVDVKHDGGTSTVAVDQRLDPEQWSIIGTFMITDLSSEPGKVTIRNERANGQVIADGVRWVKINRPTCDAMGYRCQQPLCPLGDCYTSLRADDPTSKVFQAKDALFEVIQGSPNVHFGFGTYQQDDLRLLSKHWLYRVRDTDALGNPYTLPQLGSTDFLEVGAEEVFGNYSQAPPNRNPNLGGGDGFNCMSNFFLPDHRVGCEGANPADLSDPWEVERARRIPKLGRLGTWETEAWYRVDHNGNQTYKVIYSPATGMSFGADPFAADYEIQKCPGGGACASGPALDDGTCDAGDGEDCTQTLDCNGEQGGNPGLRYCCGAGGGETPVSCTDLRCGSNCNDDPFTPITGTIYYDLVSDYAAQDDSLKRQPITGGGFFSVQTNTRATNGCAGMDANDDTPADIWNGYDLRWPTVPDPRGDDFDFDGTPDVPREDFYDLGDRVPLDWLSRNQAKLLTRLAPNIVPPAAAPAGLPESPPDHRVAAYFKDDVLPADSPSDPVNRKLRLRDEAERPVVPFGSTPLANSLASLLDWYRGATGTDDAWSDFVAGEDPLFGCRQKFALLLTDGLEECSGGACPGAAPAAALLAAGIETKVVGFGVPGRTSSLSCIAEAGGSELLAADNRDELITQLNTLLADIAVESRAFASASIPAIQSSSADKIFLSSFSPLPGVSFWPGRIDAFRKPLPLTVDNEPDIGRVCVDLDVATDDLQSACHVWEAGTMLCQQAPEDATVDLQLGDDPATERRVIYGKAHTGSRPNALQLFDMPTLPAAIGDPLDGITQDLLEALDPTKVDDWNGNSLAVADLDAYLMNVIGGTLEIKVIDPAFEDQVEGCPLSAGEGYILGDIFHANPTSIESPGNFTYFANNINGYRDFARKHAWRRKMLAAGTNDGQLHFFDTGIRQVVDNDFTSIPGDFIELYNDGGGHELFSYIPRFALPILEEQVDSTRHIFSLDNTVAIGDVFIDPDDDATDETQWRTVVVGSLREAGDVLDTVADVRNFKSGYYALDVTAPDVVNPRSPSAAATDPTWVACPKDATGCDESKTDFDPEYTPSCLDFTTSTIGEQSKPGDCDFPFPMELWTFADSVEVSGVTYYLDEDKDAMGVSVGNAIPDLADTWSRAVIGQIQVCGMDDGACDPDDSAVGAGADLEVRQVAIFGGGMDPERKGAAEVGGNFLYIVDVETGEAFYKRELEGPAAGDPAVLDVDRDGLFDRIYIGTTDGLLYKVDLAARKSGTNNVPGFDDPMFEVDEENLLSLDADGNATRYTASPGGTITLQLDRISDPAWDPFVILDTGGPYEVPVRRGGPIFHAPAAFYIPELNQYGLAIGTGDREDLWDEANGEAVVPGMDPLGGRFFVIVDQDLVNDSGLYNSSEPCATRLPITEACLKSFDFNVDPTATELQVDYLLAPENDSFLTALVPSPRPGWVMTFTPQARITNEAFIVAGVLVFSAFDPAITTTTSATCAQTGVTRAFVLSVKNASPIAPLGGGASSDPSYGERAIDRYHEIGEFTTAPFIDSTASKNPSVEGGDKTLLDEIDEAISDAVRNSLIDNFPRGSRFNKAFSLVIAALRNSTGVSVYTTIPIAIYPADWKDQ